MKKISLFNLNLKECNRLSLSEKKVTIGGYASCGVDSYGFVWQQCQSGLCVRDLSECPDGDGGGPCIDGPMLPSGNCSDLY